MKRSDVAAQVPGVKPDDLLNWERLGFLRPDKIPVGERLERDYTPDDVRIVRGLALFKRAKFPLREIYEWIKDPESGIYVYLLIKVLARKKPEILSRLRDLQQDHGLLISEAYVVYGGPDIICRVRLPTKQALEQILWPLLVRYLESASQISALTERDE